MTQQSTRPHHSPAAPLARRAGRPGWRDPRILLGVAIVAISVLAGAWLLAGADNTVGVWAVRRDLPAGAHPTISDLQRREVHFGDAGLAEAYLSADTGLPSGARLTRKVSAGELLPAAAVSTTSRSPRIEVPLSVVSDDLPATVRPGSVVDVWVVSQKGDASTGDARLVLAGVTVASLPASGSGLAPSATRQVIVAVPVDRTDLGAALGELAGGRVVITRKD